MCHHHQQQTQASPPPQVHSTSDPPSGSSECRVHGARAQGNLHREHRPRAAAPGKSTSVPDQAPWFWRSHGHSDEEEYAEEYEEGEEGTRKQDTAATLKDKHDASTTQSMPPSVPRLPRPARVADGPGAPVRRRRLAMQAAFRGTDAYRLRRWRPRRAPARLGAVPSSLFCPGDCVVTG